MNRAKASIIKQWRNIIKKKLGALNLINSHTKKFLKNKRWKWSKRMISPVQISFMRMVRVSWSGRNYECLNHFFALDAPTNKKTVRLMTNFEFTRKGAFVKFPKGKKILRFLQTTKKYQTDKIQSPERILNHTVRNAPVFKFLLFSFWLHSRLVGRSEGFFNNLNHVDCREKRENSSRVSSMPNT